MLYLFELWSLVRSCAVLVVVGNATKQNSQYGNTEKCTVIYMEQACTCTCMYVCRISHQVANETATLKTDEHKGVHTYLENNIFVVKGSITF